MKHLKKSLSLFLCIVLSLSLFPVPAAYAEEAGSEETEHVSAINVFEQVIDEFDENSSSDIEDPDLEEQPVLQNGTSSKEQETSHEHSFSAAVTDPTCTEQGFTTYTCNCGDSYVDDYTEALNHPEIIDVPEIPATETEPGITAGKKCAVCGEILEGCDEIAVLEENNFRIDEKTDDYSLASEKNDAPDLIVEEI